MHEQRLTEFLMSRLNNTPELKQILVAFCEKEMTSAQVKKMEQMAGDPAAIQLLVDYLQMDTDLRRLVRRQTNLDRCLSLLELEKSSGDSGVK